MLIARPSDLLLLKNGELIKRTFLSTLIQESKIEGSKFYEDEFVINGTPFRGINWIGIPPRIKFVIAKSILPPENRFDDKWIDDEHTKYQYFFQTLNGLPNLNHNNNIYLDQQRYNHTYPVLLLREKEDKLHWRFEGKFNVIGPNRRDKQNICCILSKIA